MKLDVLQFSRRKSVPLPGSPKIVFRGRVLVISGPGLGDGSLAVARDLATGCTKGDAASGRTVLWKSSGMRLFLSDSTGPTLLRILCLRFPGFLRVFLVSLFSFKLFIHCKKIFYNLGQHSLSLHMYIHFAYLFLILIRLRYIFFRAIPRIILVLFSEREKERKGESFFRFKFSYHSFLYHQVYIIAVLFCVYRAYIKEIGPESKRDKYIHTSLSLLYSILQGKAFVHFFERKIHFYFEVEFF